MYVNVNAAGDWLQDVFDFHGAGLVASSRSGATQVWRLVNGKLVQVQHYKSGNVELLEVEKIPDYLQEVINANN